MQLIYQAFATPQYQHNVTVNIATNSSLAVAWSVFRIQMSGPT